MKSLSVWNMQIIKSDIVTYALNHIPHTDTGANGRERGGWVITPTGAVRAQPRMTLTEAEFIAEVEKLYKLGQGHLTSDLSHFDMKS